MFRLHLRHAAQRIRGILSDPSVPKRRVSARFTSLSVGYWYAAIVCAVLAVGVLSSIGLSNARSALGVAHIVPLTQAWLVSEVNGSEVVSVGQPIVVDVNTSTIDRVTWRLTSGNLEIDHGSFASTPGLTHRIVIPTSGASPRSWIRVYISNTIVPLQVYCQ